MFLGGRFGGRGCRSVDFGVVFRALGVDEGSEGGRSEGSSGGAVEGGESEGEDALDGAGEGAVVGDALGFGGDEAGGAMALAGDVCGDVSEQAGDGGEVEVTFGAEGWRGQGSAGLDGGGAIGAVAGETGEGEEVGGVALGDALLAGDKAAGSAGCDGLWWEGVAEAGVAAVLEGVEVALGGAAAGARTPTARLARRRGRDRDEVGRRLGHGRAPRGSGT